MQTEINSKRLALVIGNSFYDSFSELKNSKNDAADVKVKLESLGFAIDDNLSVDHTYREMVQDVLNFTKRIHKGVTDIVVYYAGHGCSIHGENFLVPVDGLSPDDDPSTAKQTYIRLDWLIDIISKNRPQDIPIIFIVDCCRTEIANDQQVHSDPIKSTAAIPNVFIMYATANGHVAMDGGAGRNGAFTERLLEYLDADKTIVEISNMIAKDLKGKQTHWISSSMDDNYRFRQLPIKQTKAFAHADLIKVPFRRNNFFIGRAEILKEMERNLCRNQPTGQCVPLALSGLGGMGKTQLMLQYHHIHCDEYKDIFWLNSEGKAAAMDMFRHLAETLGIGLDKDEKSDRDEMLAVRIRERLETSKDRWLLMLDNVDTISDVSSFIPNKGGDVIITTRDHVDRRWGSVIHVDKMSKEDALLLLVGPQKRSTPSKAAMEIIEEMDRMPLAIDIVRAYVDRTGATLKSYLKIYKKKSTVLLHNTKDTNSDQYKNTIATVWDVSLERIRDQNKLAELILCNCAVLQSDTIPVSLFERQAKTLSLDASVESIHDAIGLLAQFSFVQQSVRRDADSDANRGNGKVDDDDEDGDSDGDGDDDDDDDDDGDLGKDVIIVHRLVQAVVRDMCMERNELWRIYERVIAAFDKEIVTGDCYDHQVHRTYALFLPHIREIVRLVDWRQMDAKSQSLLGKLISKTVWHYVEFGQGYQSLEDLAKFSRLISEESNGLDHPDTAASLFNLASIYKNEAKYNEAEPLYQQSLAIREKVLEPDHPETAQSLNGLASLRKKQEKYDLAEQLYQRALAIHEKALGPDHLDTAMTLHNLALIYLKQHEHNKALPLLQRSLAIREKMLGPNHPNTSRSLNYLASCYDYQGKYDEAEPLYQRALAIQEKVLGPDHPSTATPTRNLALHYFNHGKYDKAEPLYRRAIAIQEKTLGPDHPRTVLTLRNLSELYEMQGKHNNP